MTKVKAAISSVTAVLALSAGISMEFAAGSLSASAPAYASAAVQPSETPWG
jgi:hypothetical protein